LEESSLERLQAVRDRIERAARRCGRHSDDITLVAVTKTVPLDRVHPMVEAGVAHIGENRVQEALTKFSAKRPGVTYHLLGPLQSNKARKAVAFFDVIQSLDRWELAQDVNRHAAALGKKQTCLVEVKISPEVSKSGVPPEQLHAFLDRLAGLPHVDIHGLMGIPPLEAAAEKSRPYFARLRELAAKSNLRVLSMGMSRDFEIAIEEGATMVRIGTALFGSRPR
jgi:pyridoxal phosphate enzyme (YggS family)